MKESNSNEKNINSEQEPSWQSFWITIAVFIILAALFFAPLHCSAQVTCECYHKDTSVDKQSATIHFDVDVLKLMEAIRYDTTFLRQDVVVSPERIIIQQQSKLWPLVILRIAGGIILLLAFVFSLKYLVPYWTRIAEMNYKLKERGMIEENRRKQEKQEHEIREEKIELDLYEKLGKMKIEETARDCEHRRKLELLKAEKK